MNVDMDLSRTLGVLFVAVVVLSLIGVGSIATSAQTSGDLTVNTTNETVAPNGDTTVTLESTDAEHLEIEGDTDGWTITEMNPVPTLTGNPTSDDGFPYESGNESWFYADSTTDSLTVDLEATVPEGDYDFVAKELDEEGNVVSEESFTITVERPDEALFDVSNLDPSETTVTQGESVNVSATVTNTGGQEATKTVEFSLDGETQDTTSVTLDAEDAENVSFSLDTEELSAADYTHAISTEDDEENGTLTVTDGSESEPPEELTVSVSESTIAPNGDTTVTLQSADAERLEVVGETDGWTIGDMNPIASLLGNPTAGDLPYESGADETWYYADETHDELTIDLEATVEEGEYEFTARELDENDEVVSKEPFTITVERPEEAVFDVSGLDPVEATVAQGDTINASATIENTGGQEATKMVEFRLDNETLASQNVTLESGAETEVVFENVNITDVESGDYTHSVSTEDDEQTGTLSVTDEDGPAPIPDNLTVKTGDGTVSPNGTITVTVQSADAEHLRVVGDTEGWTIVEMDPIGSLIGNPSVGDLPYESGDEPWYYAEDTHDELTIELEATVEEGEYEFTASERSEDDEIVAETNFTVEVAETQYDDWPVNPALAGEVDADNDGELKLSEIRTAVEDWSGNGQVGDSSASLSDLRALVEFWGS